MESEFLNTPIFSNLFFKYISFWKCKDNFSDMSSDFAS